LLVIVSPEEESAAEITRLHNVYRKSTVLPSALREFERYISLPFAADRSR